MPTEAEPARAEGREYELPAALLQRILAERRAKWERENPGKRYQEPEPPDTSELPELPEGWRGSGGRRAGHHWRLHQKSQFSAEAVHGHRFRIASIPGLLSTTGVLITLTGQEHLWNGIGEFTLRMTASLAGIGAFLGIAARQSEGTGCFCSGRGASEMMDQASNRALSGDTP